MISRVTGFYFVFFIIASGVLYHYMSDYQKTIESINGISYINGRLQYQLINLGLKNKGLNIVELSLDEDVDPFESSENMSLCEYAKLRKDRNAMMAINIRKNEYKYSKSCE